MESERKQLFLCKMQGPVLFFFLFTISTINLPLMVLSLIQPKCDRGMLFHYFIGMPKLLQITLKSTDRSTHVDVDIC